MSEGPVTLEDELDVDVVKLLLLELDEMTLDVELLVLIELLLLLLDELVEELLVEDETIVVLLTLLVLLLITLLSLLVVEEEVDDVISPFPWQLTSEKSITLKTKIFFS